MNVVLSVRLPFLLISFTFTRFFVHKMVDLLGSLSELCSFLVMGMISYNVRPFEVHWSWILLLTIIVYVSRYAAISGVMATILRWVDPGTKWLDQNHSILLFLVYRGSMSFILTARAEGELLANDQVVFMMRLSLCLIWVSLIQHVLFSFPLSSSMRYEEFISADPVKDDASDMENLSFVDVFNRWVYALLVRDQKNEEESQLLPNNETVSEKEMLVYSVLE